MNEACPRGLTQPRQAMWKQRVDAQTTRIFRGPLLLNTPIPNLQRHPAGPSLKSLNHRIEVFGTDAADNSLVTEETSERRIWSPAKSDVRFIAIGQNLAQS